jgi:hypothetical protein
LELVEVSVSGNEVLVGSARFAQDAQQATEAEQSYEELARLQRALEVKGRTSAAHIAAMQAEAEADLEELRRRIAEQSARAKSIAMRRAALIEKRMQGISVDRTEAWTRAPRGKAAMPRRGNGK